MNPNPEVPKEIKEAIKRQTELQMELQGIEMTNVYGKDIDAQVALNVRRVQVLRELAEVGGTIQFYIDEGAKPVAGRYWQDGTPPRG